MTKEIKPSEIDHSLTSNIIASDIPMWIIARMAQIRDAGLPVNSAACHVYFREDGSAFIGWSMHACGKCVTSADTIVEASQQLREILFSNPSAEASFKRQEAAELLRQAEKLEQLATVAKETA